MTFALIFFKGTASGNLLDVHMLIVKYWCPDLLLGSSSKQSTIEGPLVAVTVLLERSDSVSQPSNRCERLAVLRHNFSQTKPVEMV